MKFQKKRFLKNYYSVKRYGLQQAVITFGSILTAFGYTLFQVPFDITAGGLSGLAIIINHFTGWSEGVLFFVMNIPLVILGYFHLGRWRFIASTTLCLIVFSFFTDLFIRYLPGWMDHYPLTDNILLASLYAGICFGIGNGIIFRAGGSFPGTTIPGRIIQQKTGFPLSQSFLFTDTAIIFAAGLVFGWELALLAMISLFFSGLAADYVLEGVSQVRTAMIVTDKPRELNDMIMKTLGRGVTHWEVTGGYTGRQHTMVYCTVYRSQVMNLKYIASQVDPDAFIVIGVAQQAIGGTSFTRIRKPAHSR